MKDYFRAYRLGDLRAFPGWAAAARPEAAELGDDAIVYVRGDLAVVRSPVLAEPGILWDTLSPQWHEFCASALHFEIPEDLRFART
ncbi:MULTISPECIES: hypothetical protein [Amycolatopsis]|uniref:Uncharacterized protein n=1 Tax=Amycolatopsis albidoflavus TaxID=102226 RepID=A0ABW5HX44_9PSEU